MMAIHAERKETLHLSMTTTDALLATLKNPPKANDKLFEAAKHYKATVDVCNNY